MLRFLPRNGFVAILALPLLAACGATCDRVCHKLLECGEAGILQTDRFSAVECEQSCERQGEVFVGWDDEQEFQQAWDEHRDCLIESECGAIADGACFDDRFFVIGS